jgi:threonine aldolase
MIRLSEKEPTNEKDAEMETSMIRFESDYSEGAHQKILNKLQETNLEQTPGYSEDQYCDAARGLITAQSE